jgi:hypothetical protein
MKATALLTLLLAGAALPTLDAAEKQKRSDLANCPFWTTENGRIPAFGLGDPIGNRNLPDYALAAFGKPARETYCDCERSTVPTLLQSLYLKNDPEMLARLETQRDGMPTWITELRTKRVEPARIDPLITETLLRTVSRPPTFDELQKPEPTSPPPAIRSMPCATSSGRCSTRASSW